MIHQYKNNGYNIVLDVNSGSVHVVDDVVYDVVPLVEEALNAGCAQKEIEERVLSALKESYTSDDLTEALSEIMELKEAGMLFAPDIYENYMDVVVLQIMTFGDNEFLCELIDVKEFEADGK